MKITLCASTMTVTENPLIFLLFFFFCILNFALIYNVHLEVCLQHVYTLFKIAEGKCREIFRIPSNIKIRSFLPKYLMALIQ